MTIRSIIQPIVQPIVKAIQEVYGFFSPASLFTNGEQGAWFDPSDLTTLFQDSAGTTPVTAVEQPVGLMLDKSKGLVLGAELVSNGDFSSGTTGWNTDAGWSISDGAATATEVSINSSAIYQNGLTLVTGRTYAITFTVVSVTSGSVYISSFSGVNGKLRSAAGTYTEYFRASGTSSALIFRGGSAGTNTITIDNISVREIPGNHATQATSANRPTLSARYNLLTKTEAFDDAVWSKANASITANATTAPDGTATADKLVEGATTNTHYTRVTASVSASTSCTLSFYAKAAGRSYCSLNIYAVSPAANIAECYFDLALGVVQTPAAGSASISSVGNGWYRCSVTGTMNSSTSAYITMFVANTSSTNNYTGDGTSGIYIWGADLRPADQATGLIPNYQRVNTSTDYDTNGFPTYLSFNGTSSSMSTGSIDFTATDKMSVFAGVRKLSDAASGIIVELSNTYTNYGSFFLANDTSPSVNFEYSGHGDRAGAVNDVATSPVSAPNTSVLTAQQSINSGAASTIRRNGSLADSSINTTFGGGNFGNYPLYVGARAGSSLFFNGKIHQLVIRGAASSAAQITSAENYVNQKTKAY